MEFIFKSIFPACMSSYFDLLRFFFLFPLWTLSLSFSIMWDSRLGSGFWAKHIFPQVRWRSLGMIAASAVLAFDLAFPFDEKRKFLNFHFEFQKYCFILLAHFWVEIFLFGSWKAGGVGHARVKSEQMALLHSAKYVRLFDWWEQSFGR